MLFTLIPLILLALSFAGLYEYGTHHREHAPAKQHIHSSSVGRHK